ncbi:hypothetical protein GCM10027175_19420 [Hymenobacter latericoloratus]
MNATKQFLGSILAIAFFLLLVVIFREHIPGKRNQHNSYLVRVGMPKQQAVRVMGGAPSRRISGVSADSAYVYKASPAASDNIYLGIGADGTITSVSHGQ